MASNSNVVSKYYNSLKETGLGIRNESNILYLRNFNNWIKSNLIQQYISQTADNYKEIRVLDLGSGKGGDQLKWAKAFVSHVTFLDIAQQSIEQSQERYDKGRFRYSADYIVANFTTVDFESIIKRNYHIISCQFAFHYSFESHTQANLTFHNVSTSLHENGYFIGTTVNAFELVKRLKQSPDNSFGNALYKVTFPADQSKDDIALFGSKYDFYLEGSVNCPEFVVYPPLMDKMAEQHGLELVERCSFPEFYGKHSATPEGRGLLGKIRALQEVRVKDLAGLDETEYPGVGGFTDEARFFKVLTMSQSEWEVVQLYDVFVYRKV